MSIGFALILLIFANYIGGGSLNLVIQIVDVACNVLSLLLELTDRCAYGLILF